MRIIGGEARGRRLYAPAGSATRPTADMVREAVFDLLPPLSPDDRVLDLFAGAGALGLEALSRGAARVFFTDSSAAAVRAVRRNLVNLSLEHRAEVWHGPAQAALARYARRGLRFDLVFLDPPYRSGLLGSILMEIVRLGLLSPAGRAVAEHSFRDPAPEVPGLQVWKDRRYGSTAITIYILRGALTDDSGSLPG